MKFMKRMWIVLAVLLLCLAGCAAPAGPDAGGETAPALPEDYVYAPLISPSADETPFVSRFDSETVIALSDGGITVNSITTAKEQKLYLDGADAALMKGKKILIVDDVISTGESLKALEALVEKAGGEICGRMAILAEGDAIGRSDLVYLEPLPLFNPDGTVLG